MPKFIKALFLTSILASILSIALIIFTYLIIKPNLPEIKYVDESELQMPLKVFTKDGILIGEFGEIKRRAKSFDEIPHNIKSAFLAAEDDNFFYHQGISYSGLIRSFIRCIRPEGCEGGGGTITMQVVRGYLLTPEQTISRKIKEIFLALELESNVTKEKIFELYVNRVFLGNRSYGIEAAANTYFNKSLEDLSIDESATIAAIAQLPSRINPIRSPDRSLVRRNWILGRMFKLGYIGKAQYLLAKDEPIAISHLQIIIFLATSSLIFSIPFIDLAHFFLSPDFKESLNIFSSFKFRFLEYLSFAFNKLINKNCKEKIIKILKYGIIISYKKFKWE